MGLDYEKIRKMEQYQELVKKLQEQKINYPDQYLNPYYPDSSGSISPNNSNKYHTFFVNTI